MNAADQEAGNKAIDSLINYETVKVSRDLIKSITGMSGHGFKKTKMIIALQQWGCISICQYFVGLRR